MFLVGLILLLSIRNLKTELFDKQLYLKVSLEWIPQIISILLIIAEIRFQRDVIHLIALSVTFRQMLTLFDMGEKRMEIPDTDLFLYIFAQSIQLFIMAVILTNVL